ncbi:MAG: hypothetical protein J0H71_18050 [Rhizobiales bacterium]|nr:hypothetical protein [Hyphomicrobiales bacterium]
MPTASLNAFLKIVSKNSPQKASEYGRYLTPGGYDFYWSLKDASRALTVGGEAFEECCKTILKIKRPPERKHNLSGLKSLEKWATKIEASGFFASPVAQHSSPAGYLTIKIEPTFGYLSGGKRRLVHLWASQTLSLPRNVAGCGLYLMKEHICTGEFEDCVPAILDLRKRELFVADKLPPMTAAMLASELAWADSFFATVAKAA